MKDETKARLTGILDAFDAKRSAAAEKAERVKTDREAFLEAFASSAKSIIRPAMEEVLEQLRSRGHDGEIRERAETKDHNGRTQNAEITLTVFPSGQRPLYSREHEYPHLAVTAHPSSNKVYLHESTMMPDRGGAAGSAGEFSLDEITPDLVQQRTLKVLAQAMG